MVRNFSNIKQICKKENSSETDVITYTYNFATQEAEPEDFYEFEPTWATV